MAPIEFPQASLRRDLVVSVWLTQDPRPDPSVSAGPWYVGPYEFVRTCGHRGWTVTCRGVAVESGVLPPRPRAPSIAEPDYPPADEEPEFYLSSLQALCLVALALRDGRDGALRVAAKHALARLDPRDAQIVASADSYPLP